MKRSKLLTTLLVVVLILSFVITTVGAQGEIPPVGELDEDGDLIVDVFPQVDVNATVKMPDLASLISYADLSYVDGTVSTDTVPVDPTAGEFVVNKYPTFRFSEDPGALKYKIEVVDILPEPDLLVYTFKGPPDCVAGECELTPTTGLKPLTMFFNRGIYLWRVRSKTDLGWGDWSATTAFIVLKNGFNSTFTTLDSKWFPVYGTWKLTSTGYAKTNGELNLFSSAIEKHVVSDFYVYEVKMKRKVESYSTNRIYFQAYPFDLLANKTWNDGYFFQYFDDQAWHFYKVQDGVHTLLLDGTSPYINPHDWNTLTVFTDTPWIDLWINGQYLGCTGPYGCVAPTDSTFTSGYVGFGMYEAVSDLSPLLVDYAKLYYTFTFPYPLSIGADGQRVPVEQTQLPVIVENPDVRH